MGIKSKLIADEIRELNQGYPIEKTVLFHNRNSIADFIEQQEKYAELGRLAIEVKGRTCSKGTFETVTDGTCINCEKFNFCQKRAELLDEN